MLSGVRYLCCGLCVVCDAVALCACVVVGVGVCHSHTGCGCGRVARARRVTSEACGCVVVWLCGTL